MAQHQTALEKKATKDNMFVTAEHFFEDFAKRTQDIAKRAFELFEERGHRFGNELEDWFKAESELFRRVPVEVKEVKDNLELRAQVPGFTADNLQVSVEPHRITIKGGTEEKSEKEDDGMIYSEWKSNKIFRSIDLPCRVEAGKATATVKDGVLTLSIPKTAETKPNEIEIKSA